MYTADVAPEVSSEMLFVAGQQVGGMNLSGREQDRAVFLRQVHSGGQRSARQSWQDLNHGQELL